jgi:hypothetical protein
MELSCFFTCRYKDFHLDIDRPMADGGCKIL